MTDHAVGGHAFPGVRSNRCIAAFAALFLLAPAYVFAEGTATLEVRSEQSNSQMDMSWRDDNLRLDLPDEAGGYLVVQGDKAYSVTQQQGETMVLDMSSLREMGQSGEQGGGVDTDIGSLEKLEATGETETIAGIDGDVYNVVWTDANGDRHENTAVLSEHELVRGMSDAFRRSAEAMGGNGDLFNDALQERGAGVLRFSDDFRVVDISGDAPPASDFELPAEPMSLQDLMRQQMGQ